MIVRLALLVVVAAACSGTQAGVVDEPGTVETQQSPTTAATAAPAATSSTASPTITAQPADAATTDSASIATSSAAPTAATPAPDAASSTAPPSTTDPQPVEEPSTTDPQPGEEPTTTTTAVTDDESAEPSPSGFVTPEPGASAGTTGRALARTDRLVLLVRCLTGSESDLHPSVLVRRQVGDPLSEWTEPASWQYRFNGSDEAVQVNEGQMSGAEIKAFIDALALTDATQMHIDTYDPDGAQELTATLSLANKHLPIEVIHACQTT